MIRCLFPLLALLSLTTPTRANLGDNIKQLVSRYGTPVTYSEATPANPFGTVVFQAGGITLMVFLLGEIEVGARVSKTDKTPLSDAERQTIMGADTGGSQWKSVSSNDPTCLQWTRSDNATAIYDTKKNMLIFTSDQMAKALDAARAAQPAPAASPMSSGTATPAK